MAKQPPDNCSGAYPLFGNKYIQFGNNNYFSGTATDESEAFIWTNLTHVDTGIALADDTYAAGTGTDGTVGVHVMNLLVERVVSSGLVKVSRSTQAGAQGACPFSYILIGDQDDTA